MQEKMKSCAENLGDHSDDVTNNAKKEHFPCVHLLLMTSQSLSAVSILASLQACNITGKRIFSCNNKEYWRPKT